MQPSQPQPALLFIPDISGFTQFVTETEISHSQHIVQELLEILIESNDLGMEVCEIEGDAIFFFRTGSRPSVISLLQQVEKMFTRFHSHLKLYEHQRICPCGACKAAITLTLKVVAHFGEVAGLAIRDHRKLFGKDVIVVHRLLKNNLDKKEYVLFTDSLDDAAEANSLPSWYMPHRATEQYDVGEVPFSFADLADLHKNVRAELPVHNSAAKTYVAFAEKQPIDHSMQDVFNTLLAMQRSAMAERGSGNAILKIGESHPCLITRNNNRNVVESVTMSEDRIEMVEMSEKGVAGYRYIMDKAAPDKTNLSIEMLVRNNAFFRIGMAFGIRSRMVKKITSFFSDLKAAAGGVTMPAA
jgi:Protein of unknown function (DUF2652)